MPLQNFRGIMNSGKNFLIIASGFLLAIMVGTLSVYFNSFLFGLLPVFVVGAIALLIGIFREPFVGLVAVICYSFLLGIPGREMSTIPFGIGNEILLLITWISVWYHARKFDFSNLRNDLMLLVVVWFIISCLELVNLSGASFMGWLQEMRTVALYPLMITPLGLLMLNTKKRLNFFLILCLVLSLIACLNGIKQLKIGLSPGEQAYLDANPTHLIWGNLRVFSFFTDAGQFGASQAQFFVIALILFFAVKRNLNKIILVILALLFFYGMLISGTRGAFFVVMAGIIIFVLLSKNLKTIIIGGAFAILGFGVLKFTNLGQGNYQIARLRSSVNPEDASFNLRLQNQLKLREYLASKPFGGGLGVIGVWGNKYNSGNYLSSIAPDSYWVKVWAMYGIIGLIIFFCIWMYWIGKCAGMIWKIKDRNLKLKLVGLLGGVVGIFISSYGNEVMNVMPTLLVIHLSLAAIYIMSKNYKEQIKFL